MRIELKKNNFPTKVGYYIIQRVKYSGNPMVAEIRGNDTGDAFNIVTGIGYFPLANLEPDALFSDKITFYEKR